jgi:hypothetical protein
MTTSATLVTPGGGPDHNTAFVAFVNVQQPAYAPSAFVPKGASNTSALVCTAMISKVALGIFVILSLSRIHKILMALKACMLWLSW